MVFYDRVSSLCKENGTSLAALAREIGLSNSAATYWKRGSVPKGETLQTIADYFDTTVDYLLGRTDDPENSDRFGLDLPELWQSQEEYSEFILNVKEGEFHTRMNTAFFGLNFSGKQEAVKRVEELTEIPRYCAETPTQPIPREPGGKDTTPAEPPPESPEKGG